MKAMRFETQVVELSTALMTGNEEMAKSIQDSLVEQISELPLTVNTVAQQKDLIEQVQQYSWWAQPSHEKLQTLTEKLAPLMKFREGSKTPMMELAIKDLLAIKESIEFGPENERISTSAYREKVEAHIQALVDENDVLQRLKAGQEVSESDIHQLAELLRNEDPYVTEELLRKVYDHKAARFIQFLMTCPRNMYRALLHLRAGRADRALADLDAAIRRDQHNPGAYIHRGRLLASRGQFRRAIADWQRALPLVRGSAVEQQLTEWIRAARTRIGGN